MSHAKQQLVGGVSPESHRLSIALAAARLPRPSPFLRVGNGAPTGPILSVFLQKDAHREVEPYVPAPSNSITCGLDEALSIIEIIPCAAPFFVGENLALIVQVAPAATAEPHVEDRSMSRSSRGIQIQAHVRFLKPSRPPKAELGTHITMNLATDKPAGKRVPSTRNRSSPRSETA
jgi:hypothetical protein